MTQKNGTEVPCDNCNKLVYKAQWQLKRKNRFCCGACFDEWHASHKAEVTCSNCQRPLLRHRYRCESTTNHFCNSQCHAKWLSRRTGMETYNWKRDRCMVKCATCSKEVRVSPSKASRNENYFCSRNCYGQWRELTLSGSGNYNWKGGYSSYYGPNWNAQARKARSRDGNLCRVCGKTKEENRRNMDVHHIVPFREFGYVLGENENYREANALGNLISLCQICHSQVECGAIELGVRQEGV